MSRILVMGEAINIETPLDRNRRKVLVVDDDQETVNLVRINLEVRGYEVLTAQNGATALALADTQKPDLVILDVLLPDMEEHEVCRKIREGSEVPIIMLTVKTEEEAKVTYLSLGADDYLTKPFGMQELLARVKAVLRRTSLYTQRHRSARFSSGPIEIDFDARQVTVNKRVVQLSPTEYNLLQQLALNAGKALTHFTLLQKVWEPEYGEECEYLRVYIRRLRKKLEPDPTHPCLLVTEPRVGYRFQLASPG